MDLKFLVKLVNDTGSHFFTRSSMRFFGDTMRNYYVVKDAVKVQTPSGDIVECWALGRRRPVKHGLQSMAFFSTETKERVHGELVEEIPVLFRKDKSGEITAVFPTIPATNFNNDWTCYAHVGQHSSCQRAWVAQTKNASADEYASLLSELQQRYAPHTLTVLTRLPR